MPRGFRKDGSKLGFQKGIKNPKYGKKFTQKEKREMGIRLKGINAGNKSRFWKGGRRKTNGYWEIYHPKHPFCSKKKYVRKHRLVMENHLKRFLNPQEIVHHINGNILDNRIKNLMLFSNNREHSRFHRNQESKNKLLSASKKT